MKQFLLARRGLVPRLLLLFSIFIFWLALASQSRALTTVNLINTSDGSPVITGYRWVIEEDKTYHVQLDTQREVIMDPDGLGGTEPRVDPNWDQGKTLAVSFHQSHMPVVASSSQGVALNLVALDPTKNYFISILPDSGFTLGGAQFTGDQTSVDVYLNPYPIPTAQISILVHEDMEPINGGWDEGEIGLSGFQIILEDAGGKYGISAGVQSLDVYGNPLCTLYATDIDGNYIPDPQTVYQIAPASPTGCTTGADGRITISNIAPGKYGVMAAPPQGSTWIQTSTIEGTKVIDAWVQANEPALVGDFGPPRPHVSFGFVPAGQGAPYIDGTVLTGGQTITGRVVNLHLSRAPSGDFFTGGPFPHTPPWVGLNDTAGGTTNRGIYAARTTDGVFSITNVPPGDYQLVIWDENLDLIFATSRITVDGTGCNGAIGCALGDVGAFQWFNRLENFVFYDGNANNIADDGEGLLEQNINVRWRDGTIYQAFPTDATGFAPFDQIFPFFAWFVAEVDFARFKATGATVTVDDGGPIPFGTYWSFGDQLTPQDQTQPAEADPTVFTDATSRVETGPVLTQAFLGFLGQTSVIQWKKEAYGVDENGGISGIVYYAVTRAENNPELAAAEPWEPGIPNVTVNLYDQTGTTLLATTQTDSWDSNRPTGCKYGSGIDRPYIFRGDPIDCFDGMRNWNQVRPGVFDGGYAFGPQFDIADFGGTFPAWVQPSVADPTIGYMVPGDYVVEVVPPAGYQIIRAHDKNVDFGYDYGQPAPQLLPPPCVGTAYPVAAELSLFPGVPSPYPPGTMMPECDRKQVILSSGANAAADFFIFTEVPISGHLFGFLLDDTANDRDPGSPQFGERYAPPFLPISIQDWTGQEIARTVSDEYGRYNALVPSTFTQNLGQPSGISPNMLTACMNDKFMVDGSEDPRHDRQYSQFCYTLQYMPGSTTYLDTPVVPVAAFAGPDEYPVDCEVQDREPRIKSVSVPTNGVGGGPYIPTDINGNVIGNHTIVLTSMTTVEVPNPAYDGLGGTQPKTIFRNNNFMNANHPGTVTLNGTPLAIVNWKGHTVKVAVPAGSNFGGVGGKQLNLIQEDGDETAVGITVQVGLRPDSKVITVPQGGSIQAAIDTARPRDLILVAPGIYNEMVIMWKPVQLQGWGEGSTFINAVNSPFDKLANWRLKIEDLLTNNKVSIIPGQDAGFGGITPDIFFSEEGAGIFVVANSDGFRRFRKVANRGARIDGFNISGANIGGGIVVNGFGDFIEISNNKITNNTGFYAGGIRIGHPFIEQNSIPTDARNSNITIHHNSVVFNGGIDGAGGGIALHTGADSYQVTDNLVCGNFTTSSGAGIAHFGYSHKQGSAYPVPLIADNTIIFNENFNQGAPTNGGGILVAGKPPLGLLTLSKGSGSVDILNNVIQGNSAGTGDGGGIQLSRINGEDVVVGMSAITSNYSIEIINNIISNNSAGLSGAGISMVDALNVNISSNTIAHNDNSSIAAAAFTPGTPNQSTPQPGAGVATHAHLDLATLAIPPLLDPGFSIPRLTNNIIWQNRMFFWLLDDTNPLNVLTGLCPDVGTPAVGLTCPGGNTVVYDDLAVIGTGNPADTIACSSGCITTGGADPLFVTGGFNGNRSVTTFTPGVITSMEAPAAFDEGGNFIRLRFGPLTPVHDFHIQPGSSAIDAATNNLGLVDDIDQDPRPMGVVPMDAGADEIPVP